MLRPLLSYCEKFASNKNLSLFRGLSITARWYNLVGVTRRKHRAGSWYFSQKAVTVQGGYGALFAVMVQILLRFGVVAVQGY